MRPPEPDPLRVDVIDAPKISYNWLMFSAERDDFRLPLSMTQSTDPGNLILLSNLSTCIPLLVQCFT